MTRCFVRIMCFLLVAVSPLSAKITAYEFLEECAEGMDDVTFPWSQLAVVIDERLPEFLDSLKEKTTDPEALAHAWGEFGGAILDDMSLLAPAGKDYEYRDYMYDLIHFTSFGVDLLFREYFPEAAEVVGHAPYFLVYLHEIPSFPFCDNPSRSWECTKFDIQRFLLKESASVLAVLDKDLERLYNLFGWGSRAYRRLTQAKVSAACYKLWELYAKERRIPVEVYFAEPYNPNESWDGRFFYFDESSPEFMWYMGLSVLDEFNDAIDLLLDLHFF